MVAQSLYQCSICATQYPISVKLTLCPKCNQPESPEWSTTPLQGVLDVIYDYKELKSIINSSSSFHPLDLMPVKREQFSPLTRDELTPLWSPTNLQNKLGLPKLLVKDDSTLPTGSLKDRASMLVAAYAKREGVEQIVLASTGNAASSMAGIGASQGLKIVIFLPKAAPTSKLVQSRQYGAKVTLVDGNYDLAYEHSYQYYLKHGGICRNTAMNPMTIEGKKSVSLEIVKQLGGKSPDYIFVPTGDGAILSGVYKGLVDLKHLGLINKIPVVYAVQAAGSSAIFQALRSGSFTPIQATTIADSISVDVPKGGDRALRYLQEFEGKSVVVSDEEILEAQHLLASTSGIFTEPAGAASLAGLLKIKQSISPTDSVILLATGHGLKDPASAQKIFSNKS
jgi:threonine synthase